MLEKYYFTFAEDGQLFRGGWVIICAKTETAARRLFVEHYGEAAISQEGFLRFAFSYSEIEFLKTGMLDTGNFGYFCWGIIYE